MGPIRIINENCSKGSQCQFFCQSIPTNKGNRSQSCEQCKPVRTLNDASWVTISCSKDIFDWTAVCGAHELLQIGVEKFNRQGYRFRMLILCGMKPFWLFQESAHVPLSLELFQWHPRRHPKQVNNEWVPGIKIYLFLNCETLRWKLKCGTS